MYEQADWLNVFLTHVGSVIAVIFYVSDSCIANPCKQCLLGWIWIVFSRRRRRRRSNSTPLPSTTDVLSTHAMEDAPMFDHVFLNQRQRQEEKQKLQSHCRNSDSQLAISQHDVDAVSQHEISGPLQLEWDRMADDEDEAVFRVKVSLDGASRLLCAHNDDRLRKTCSQEQCQSSKRLISKPG